MLVLQIEILQASTVLCSRLGVDLLLLDHISDVLSHGHLHKLLYQSVDVPPNTC